MKLKPGFMLRKVVDTWVVVPLGERLVDFNGILTLTETAATIWDCLAASDGADRDGLLARMLDEYDVDRDTAARDLDAFLESLRQSELIEA